MKTILYLILICNYCVLHAQNNFPIPPGTIQFKDSLFIDKSPVTNLMFIEYLTAKQFLESKGYDSFSEFQKETNGEFPIEMRTMIFPSPLLELYASNKYLKKKSYGSESKFKYHPVLNISKKQAMDYCEWRTNMVRHLWKYHEKFSMNKNLSDNITYKLASKNELELANALFYNLDKAVVLKKNLFSIKQEKEIEAFTLFPIRELTVSDEIFNNNSTYEYTGFRCVCEIK